MRLLWLAARRSPAAALLFFTACTGSQQQIRVMPDGSTVKSSTRASVTESIIHSFGAGGDGFSPSSGLIDVKGRYYGTTAAGGERGGSLCAFGCGTVYRVTPDGTEDVLYSFTDDPDGADPNGIIDVSGKLYGTTRYGGAYARGMVFSVTKSGKERVLYSFAYAPDGAEPLASLINVKGKLYGTTSEGGAYGDGTVFSIAQSGQEQVLYSFKGGSYGDGAYPESNLIERDGDLYGTTARGGVNGGTVFKVSLSGKERVLYRFADYRHDGTAPVAGLVEVNGTFYGTTLLSGKYDDGTVFSVTKSGKEKVLHSFKGSRDGANPSAGLINVNGTLYGTTPGGGREGVGTVFSVDASGKERIVYAFRAPPDGNYPGASLIDVNGTLFGTTAEGGAYPPTDCPAYGCGTVFALSLSK